MRLRNKLFLLYVIPASLLLVFSNLIIFATFRSNIRKWMHTEMETSVTLVKDMVESGLSLSIRNYLKGISEKNREIVYSFVRQEKEGLVSRTEAEDRARRILLSQNIGKTGYLFVWDISGFPEKVILAVHPYIQGDDVTGIGFVHDGVMLRNGYMEYTWANPGEAPREKAMYLCEVPEWNWVIAVSSYRDEFLGLVSIEDFMEQVAGIRFGESGYYYILDGKGNVVFHPRLKGNVIDRADVNGDFYIREICEKKDGSIFYSMTETDGTVREKYAVYTHLPEYDWIVVSSGYIEEYYRPLTAMGWFLIAITAAIGSFLFVSASISSDLLVGPLTEMTIQLKKGAGGDYSLHMERRSNDEVGEIAGYFNTFMDTLRKNREEILSAKEFLKSIIDSLPSLLITVKGEGIVTRWNGAAERMTDVPASLAEGRAVYELLPFLSEYRETIEGITSGARGAETARGYMEQAGEKRDLSLSFLPFEGEGSDICIIRIDDITESLRKDEQLMMAQKMETVGTLAGGLAHDFNNVLGGIVGTVTLVRHIIETGENADILPYLAMIDSSAARAAEVVAQLLNLSRRTKPVKATVDLNGLLRNVVTICENTFEKRVEIRPRYSAEPSLVNASDVQLEQAFLNLCINAHDAMTIMRGEEGSHGGSLRIEVDGFVSDRRFAESHPGAGPGTPYWAVRFTDTGVGISRPDLDRIFDPFFTTKGKGLGTGLGLFMTYNIVTGHNGFIKVSSDPGRGTTFSLFFPAAGADGGSRGAEIPRGTGRILIIDDEEIILKTTSAMLGKCGYETITAAGGGEGIDAFAADPASFDLIVLDLSMPRMSGREVFRELRRIDPAAAVLLASGCRNDPRVDEILGGGAAGFIQKPFTLRFLAEEVSRALGERNLAGTG